MAITTINAETLAKMFLAGAANLDAKKEWINDLNVFPVPDGDTGTNMTLTIMSAAREVSALDKVTLSALAKAISSGSLRGARGNSGVILSQLFRGFTKVIAGCEELTCGVLATAAGKAVETAYKAVMKPKEGTILTVARGIAEKAAELADCDDIQTFMEQLIKHGDDVLGRTPEMLPVLKEAGVVDSGGQGLMQVMKGALDGLLGREIDLSIEPGSGAASFAKPSAQAEADIKFGYCTEFIIMLEKEFSEKEEQKFKAYLESIGDSIVCVAMDDIVKVHVHTNQPGNAIQKGLSYGSLTSMKIDNMREEHQEKLFKQSQQEEAPKAEKPAEAQPHKQYGFIAVSIGEGLNEIFRGLGVDHLIEGGQTMNPSTEDMLTAIDSVNADTIFILPNNKNIILAANQARDLVEEKQIIVLDTKTVPQGIAALVAFSPEATPEENEENMAEEISYVKTGQVTYAVRDTAIDGFDIKKEDIMGIGDDGILAVGKEVEKVTLDTISQMVDEDTGLISVFYGEEVSEEEAGRLAKKIEEAFPDCDLELQQGGQPIYYYIVSTE